MNSNKIIIRYIIRYLNIDDLYCCELVNRVWNQVSNESIIYELLLLRKIQNRINNDDFKDMDTFYLKNGKLPPQIINIKQLYKECFTDDFNRLKNINNLKLYFKKYNHTKTNLSDNFIKQQENNLKVYKETLLLNDDNNSGGGGGGNVDGSNDENKGNHGMNKRKMKEEEKEIDEPNKKQKSEEEKEESKDELCNDDGNELYRVLSNFDGIIDQLEQIVSIDIRDSMIKANSIINSLYTRNKYSREYWHMKEEKEFEFYQGTTIHHCLSKCKIQNTILADQILKEFYFDIIAFIPNISYVEGGPFQFSKILKIKIHYGTNFNTEESRDERRILIQEYQCKFFLLDLDNLDGNETEFKSKFIEYKDYKSYKVDTQQESPDIESNQENVKNITEANSLNSIKELMDYWSTPGKLKYINKKMDDKDLISNLFKRVGIDNRFLVHYQSHSKIFKDIIIKLQSIQNLTGGLEENGFNYSDFDGGIDFFNMEEYEETISNYKGIEKALDLIKCSILHKRYLRTTDDYYTCGTKCNFGHTFSILYDSSTSIIFDIRYIFSEIKSKFTIFDSETKTRKKDYEYQYPDEFLISFKIINNSLEGCVEPPKSKHYYGKKDGLIQVPDGFSILYQNNNNGEEEMFNEKFKNHSSSYKEMEFKELIQLQLNLLFPKLQHKWSDCLFKLTHLDELTKLQFNKEDEKRKRALQFIYV